LPGDAVITGIGKIEGHPVCIYAQDFTIAGGSLGIMHAKKICKIMDIALKLGIPIIGINDSGGAKIHSEISGNAHFFAENEEDCFRQEQPILFLKKRFKVQKTLKKH